MNKKNGFLTILFLIFTGNYPLQGNGLTSDILLSKLELLVEVVDEDGNPLPDSKVTASFRHTDRQKEKTGSWVKKFEETYDGKEAVKFSYESDPNVAIWVEKEGYWLSGLRYKFPETDRLDGNTGPNGYYRKSLTFTLRKKENPRPLYVHKVFWKEVPGFDQPYGFDLEKGDWVAPHGSGSRVDFIFKVSRKLDKEPKYWSEMILTFSAIEDGLIEVNDDHVSHSKLHLGSMAPLEGYVDQYSRTMAIIEKDGKLVTAGIPPFSEVIDIDGYWFRVRSEVNENGELVARYGKLIGPIRYKPGRTQGAQIYFTYFLAPDHSRSLEFNGESLVPKANLQGVNKH